MDIILNIVKEFLRLTLTVTPFFILGTGFGAALETWLKPGFASKYFKSGSVGVLNASLLGAILPGCACATMPMAESIKRKGAALGVVSAFIFISPLLSPHTVILNYALLGLKFTIARILFAFIGAVMIGLVFNLLQKHHTKGFSFPDERPVCLCEKSPPDMAEQKSFFRNFADIAKELGKYFLIGMFVAALLTALIPHDAIPRYIGSSGPFAYFAAVIVGIPVYICEGEEIPITQSLLKLGLGPGPAFAFLLGSVGTCIPTMIMAQKIIGRRPMLVYAMFWFLFAALSGGLFSFFYKM